MLSGPLLSFRRRSFLISLTALVILILGALIVFENWGPRDTKSDRASAEQKLTQEDVSLAKSSLLRVVTNGKQDSAPDDWPDSVKTAVAIRETRSEAARYVSSSIDDDESGSKSVIVVRATGNFSINKMGPPDTSPEATGSVMLLVLDAKTGEMLDLGILGDSDKSPLPDGAAVLH